MSPASPVRRSRDLVLAGLIALATLLVYSNSFSGAFVLDDGTWIEKNSAIRRLWPIGDVLVPPDVELAGRPVVNLTLAANYALSGLDVRGYHVVNLVIHILAAWTLFGLTRRTLLLPGLRERFGKASAPLAFTVALVWAVHPLQTQAVTYVIQRMESLCGLFYLLTLYCVLRGATAVGGGRGWYVGALAACALGMGTKEVMFTAPLVVLLYDRTFLAGSFREALALRRGWYVASVATWTGVAWLLASTGGWITSLLKELHGRTTGFGVQQFTWWSYLLTEPGVLLHYLRLVLWPSHLCLDYGWPPARTMGAIVPAALVVVGLLGLTVWALAKGSAWGFVGGWFFLILAPTSSVVPVRDAAFEHRMYLPLAGPVVLAVVGGRVLWERLARSKSLRPAALGLVPVLAWGAVAVALGTRTFFRNEDYRSAVTILEDAIRQYPTNARSHNDLGLALEKIGRRSEAIESFRRALALSPSSFPYHLNLGLALADGGEIDPALGEYSEAVRLAPEDVGARLAFAALLLKTGRAGEAAAHYAAAVRLTPGHFPIELGLASALLEAGRAGEAVEHYRAALRLEPAYVPAHDRLASALEQEGRIEEAAAERVESLRLRAWIRATHENPTVRNAEEALHYAMQACKVTNDREPGPLDALAAAYAEAGRFPEAVGAARKALDLARQSGREDLTAGIAARLEQYEAGRPWRDPSISRVGVAARSEAR